MPKASAFRARNLLNSPEASAFLSAIAPRRLAGAEEAHHLRAELLAGGLAVHCAAVLRPGGAAGTAEGFPVEWQDPRGRLGNVVCTRHDNNTPNLPTKIIPTYQDLLTQNFRGNSLWTYWPYHERCVVPSVFGETRPTRCRFVSPRHLFPIPTPLVHTSQPRNSRPIAPVPGPLQRASTPVGVGASRPRGAGG